MFSLVFIGKLSNDGPAGSEGKPLIVYITVTQSVSFFSEIFDGPLT